MTGTGMRFVAGILGLCLVLPILVYGKKIAVGLLLAVVLLVALDEFAGMAMPHARMRARAVLFPMGLAVHFALLYQTPNWVLPTACLAVIVSLTVPMFTQPDAVLAGAESSRLTLGIFYAPVLLAPLAKIHAQADGVALVFLLLAVTWLGDTGAYFAGRFFGKHKLFERVSPKKTVEGAVGGLVLSVVGASIVKIVGEPNLAWPWVVGLAVGLGIAGVAGDLAESLLKRAWGVKDSGWIMPGHGGILDRVDSLLFSAPLLWAVLQYRT